MASFSFNFKLCLPAFVYFLISMIGMIFIVSQNIGHMDSFHVGHFSCRVPNTVFVLICQFVYIVFWTYVLNLICKDGHSSLSWLLVLLPWLMFFAIMGMLMLNM